MKFDREFLRNLILYGVIGGLSAGFDAAVFALLFKILGWNSFLCNAISVHCGIFLSFFLNSHYNFRKTDNIQRRFFSFYIVGLFGLGLSTLILWAGEYLGIDLMLTKLVSIIFVAMVQFFINKFVTFVDR